MYTSPSIISRAPVEVLKTGLMLQHAPLDPPRKLEPVIPLSSRLLADLVLSQELQFEKTGCGIGSQLQGCAGTRLWVGCEGLTMLGIPSLMWKMWAQLGQTIAPSCTWICRSQLRAQALASQPLFRGGREVGMRGRASQGERAHLEEDVVKRLEELNREALGVGQVGRLLGKVSVAKLNTRKTPGGEGGRGGITVSTA